MQALIAEHADYLQRWFQLGVDMDPCELRARVEAAEAEAARSRSSGAPGKGGRLLYLPGCEPSGGQDDGTARGVLSCGAQGFGDRAK